MNGSYASDDNIDNPQLTVYSIGIVVVYAAFDWSGSEGVQKEVRNLAPASLDISTVENRLG
jgi:hypothetical protein